MPPVKKPKTKPTSKATTETKESTPVVSGQLKKKLQLRAKRAKPKRGVVYIKHLPHGFFEEQIRRYFEQFGDVTRLRLARSRRTGGSRGFAFVEFDVPEVAEVAAETMDNYLMFNKVVKATYIPPEEQQYNFFKTTVRKVRNKAGKPIYVSSKTASINRRVKKFNDWTDEAYQKRTELKKKRIQKLNEKYAHLGIDFSSVVTGSKEVEGNVNNEEKPENETGKSKTKAKPSEEKTKMKSKKSVQLEDLLGATLDEDSDDNDFELESESGKSDKDDDDETAPVAKKKRNESVSLEDLLGDTLNEDDSEDSEFELNAENDAVEQQEDSSSDEVLVEDESEDNSDEEEVKQNKKTKPANKKIKKVNKPNTDHLDELSKHKKLAGGIQKTKKVAPKKAKFGKPKNSKQAELAKELAKPMVSLKKLSKQQTKKQKK